MLTISLQGWHPIQPIATISSYKADIPFQLCLVVCHCPVLVSPFLPWVAEPHVHGSSSVPLSPSPIFCKQISEL